MRIATWNIGGGFISSTQKDVFDLEKIKYFIEELKKYQPDIVCFQEIHVSENNNQPEIVAEALGFHYIETESVSDSHLKENEKLSISIISKYPITSSKFIKLTNPNLEFIWNWKRAFSHDKGFLEVEVSYKNRTITILSGHMVPFRKFKKNPLDDEFQEIREQIENAMHYKNIPKVLCADMNFEDIHELMPKTFKQGFKFVLGDNPTTPRNSRYDKIVVSKDWILTHSEIVLGNADHYLCFADIELI